jgi:hypothetical protein
MLVKSNNLLQLLTSAIDFLLDIPIRSEVNGALFMFFCALTPLFVAQVIKRFLIIARMIKEKV